MYNKVIQENKQKFEQYNQIKLERFEQLVSNAHVWRVLSSIPLLLHTNDQRLPGYISADIPHGIVGYAPDEETLRFMKSKFPGAKFEKYVENPFVQMVAVMGSIGTIAYNKKSDFDYWVCVNKDSVPKATFAKFRKKVEEVQKWAESQIKLPVHLFINDIENVKQNIFDEDEDEAFGSTIGALLKDEFYRSSIIIAGKIPFWWVVPQFAQDAEYEDLFNRLPPEAKESTFLNLGNLYRISKEDFLGAALFQIIKSLGNPFKSIIKLGVLEKYLFEKEDTPLISQKVKINIHRGNLSNTILDSYLMMFHEVFDYYQKSKENSNILTVLRQNLYLKINPQLSKYRKIEDRSSMPYKAEEMFRSVKEWGWNSEDINQLDNFDNWDFNKIMKFWDKVQTCMLISYQKISTQFPTLNLKNKVSDSDFKLLSRKIKSHYSRQADKIEQFLTFKDTSYESLLYIEPILNEDIHEVEWRLYKRNTSEKENITITTIKKSQSLIELLVWTALNRIFEPKISRLTIKSGYTRINQHVVVNFLTQLSEFFLEEKMKIKNKYILEPVSTYLNFIVLNFNDEKHVAINKINHIYYTSWGESFLREYTDIEVLAKLLANIIKDGVRFKNKYDDFCSIHSPDPYKKIYRDISLLFKEAYTFIVDNESSDTVRFVTRIENSYIVITRDNDIVETGVYSNYVQLVATMTLKSRKRIRYKFYGIDDHSLELLSYIYENKDENSITIFNEEKGNFIFLYIINEAGNIFTFFKIKKDKNLLFSYIYSFLQTSIKEISILNGMSTLDATKIKVKTIKTDRFGKFEIANEVPLISASHMYSSSTNKAYSVSISRLMGQEPFYNITFSDGIESGFMTIKELYSIAEKLINMNKTGLSAANYINKINFLDRIKDTEEDSTQFLLEKYKVEFMVEKFLKQIQP